MFRILSVLVKQPVTCVLYLPGLRLTRANECLQSFVNYLFKRSYSYLAFLQMPDICQGLIRKSWRSYAFDLAQVPNSPGIYVIGNAAGKVLYLGHSKQMRTRLNGHKYGQQDIDQFVKQSFEFNGGIYLRIKWVEEVGHGCVEGNFLQCIVKRLGYWPMFNKKQGNTC